MHTVVVLPGNEIANANYFVVFGKRSLPATACLTLKRLRPAVPAHAQSLECHLTTLNVFVAGQVFEGMTWLPSLALNEDVADA